MKESSVSKRPREETQEEEGEVDSGEEYSKRHRPYHHILSLLESEEEDPQQDLSSLITTLQQEITNSDTHQAQQDGQHNPTTTTTTITAFEDHSDSALQSKGHSHMLKVDEEGKENKERVMRHLLEASDDELGIPNTGNNEGVVGLGFGVDDGFHGDELGYAFCDGLWELEDETANYNALLQSQLFM